MHDILQLAFARCGQQYPVYTGTGQVLAQAFGVTPYAGVVDQQRVADAVLGVIHLGRAFGIDELDKVAVDSQGVGFCVDMNDAVERTMHRVATQQAGTLDQVVAGTLAHYHGAQAQTIAATSLFDQDACQQTADTTKTVEHDVGTLACTDILLADNAAQFFTYESFGAATIAFGLELDRQLAHVDRGRTELQLAHGLEQRERLVYRQFVGVFLTVPCETVRLEELDDRAIDQTTAVDRGDNIIVTVELANQRNHRFCECFTIDPFTKTLVGLLSHGNLPHVGAEKRGYIMTLTRQSGQCTRPPGESFQRKIPDKYLLHSRN